MSVSSSGIRTPVLESLLRLLHFLAEFSDLRLSAVRAMYPAASGSIRRSLLLSLRQELPRQHLKLIGQRLFFAVSSNASFSVRFCRSFRSSASSSFTRACSKITLRLHLCLQLSDGTRSMDLFPLSWPVLRKPARAADSACACASSLRASTQDRASNRSALLTDAFAWPMRRATKYPTSSAREYRHRSNDQSLHDSSLPLRQIYAALVHFRAKFRRSFARPDGASRVPRSGRSPCSRSVIPCSCAFTPPGPPGRLEDSGPMRIFFGAVVVIPCRGPVW